MCWDARTGSLVSQTNISCYVTGCTKLDDALGDLRIRARGSSNEQLAIMVALNLSHELLLEKTAFKQYSESMERRIRQLNDVIQDALKEQSKLSIDDCN